MAISIGSISYTISKLISALKDPEIQQILNDNNSVSDSVDIDGTLHTSEMTLFDEDQIAEIFDISFSPPDSVNYNDLDENQNSSTEFEINNVIQDIPVYEPQYEEVSITEYFLRYDHDYGDLQNLMMRNDFVFNSAKLNNRLTQNNMKVSKMRNNSNENKKYEAKRLEQRKSDRLRVQKESAEKYMRKLAEMNKESKTKSS